MGSVILVAAIVILLLLWRRRAGRRQAEAQERIASVIAPLPPKGPYPKPRRGLHGLPIGAGLTIHRVCSSCSRIAPLPSGPIGESRWLLLDVCGACSPRLVGGVREVV